MEPLRHVNNKEFGAVFFRRTTVQIRNEGGLWDESLKLYSSIGGAPRESSLGWTFPSGASINFKHLEYEKTVLDWQGSQIPLIAFDELCHFTEKQFWYMVSRNRSMCGVRPYIRATCNPDAESWVADFISWWIDQETGLAIPERSGVLRWFVRVGETLIWADDPKDLSEYTMVNEDRQTIPIPPKSATFIPAKLTDNRALMKADPGYMANLLSLPLVERERLLGGNWKIKSADGIFKREWFSQFIPAAPANCRWVRGWDLAGSTQKKSPWTAGVLIGEDTHGNYIVADSVRAQALAGGMRSLIKGTAATDGFGVKGSIPQDPGQAGKDQAQQLIKMLAGYEYSKSVETGDKEIRVGGFAAQAEAGNVILVEGEWNKAYIDELCSFPISKFKDQVDATSRAFNELVGAPAPAQWAVGSKRVTGKR